MEEVIMMITMMMDMTGMMKMKMNDYKENYHFRLGSDRDRDRDFRRRRNRRPGKSPRVRKYFSQSC